MQVLRYRDRLAVKLGRQPLLLLPPADRTQPQEPASCAFTLAYSTRQPMPQLQEAARPWDLQLHTHKRAHATYLLLLSPTQTHQAPHSLLHSWAGGAHKVIAVVCVQIIDGHVRKRLLLLLSGLC